MTDYFTAEQVYQSLKEENAALQKFCHETQAENETLRMGYAAARLEIESLQARIKTMVEEHADELMVAHMDGIMRGCSTEPAGEYPALPKPGRRGPAGTGSYFDSFTADQMRAYADATCAMRAAQSAGAQQPTVQPAVDALAEAEYFIDNPSAWSNFDQRASDAIAAVCKAFRASHGQAPAQAAPQPTPTPQADSQPAPVREHALQDVRCACCGYMTYHREHIGCIRAARAPADSVLEDAAQVEIDLFNDLNRIYGNTLTAYAKEMCRLGYRKTNAARKQGANHD